MQILSRSMSVHRVVDAHVCRKGEEKDKREMILREKENEQSYTGVNNKHRCVCVSRSGKRW